MEQGTDFEAEEDGDEPGRGTRPLTTAVTLLILTSFIGVILITFYNQFTGRQTLPADLPRVAFLAEDADGVWQLFATEAFTEEPATQLTTEANDVLEFAVSPTGTAVAYVTTRPDGGTDLKLLDWNGRAAANHHLLFDCLDDTCGRLVWHPDGRRLIYERRQSNTPRLWWLDTVTGESVTVLADETAVSQSAALSADGHWLSYADPLNEKMGLYELGTGFQEQLVNVLGNTAVWHPVNEQFLFSDVDLLLLHGDDNQTPHDEHSHDAVESIHLYLGGIGGNANPLLSDSSQVDDGNPAYSPDGNWIAFGRKPYGTTAGRQLWLMQADGTESRPLTDELTIHHGPPSWSPDGRFLLFQRFDTVTPDAQPGIWLLEVGTGKMTAVVESGILPEWIP